MQTTLIRPLARAKGFYLLGSIGFLALATGYGCSVSVKEVGPSSSGAGGKHPATSATIASTGSMTTSTVASTGAGGMGPMKGADCAHAVPLATSMMNNGVTYLTTATSPSGILSDPGEKDFFKFTAKKGQWINLRTEANPNDDPMKVDTVLTLWTADGATQIAEADDGYPRAGTTDSNMDVLIPADATYCIEIQEYSTWKKMSSSGSVDFKYDLLTITLDDANTKALGNDYNLDTGNNDSLTAPQTVANLFTAMGGQQGAKIYGQIDTKTDIDAFKVTTPAGAKVMDINFEPPGPSGMGATGGIGKINIFLANGMTPYAQLDFADATTFFEEGGSYGFGGVPVTEKTAYVIQINNNGQDGGTSPGYFFKYGTGATGNQQEANDAGNNAAAGAEVTTETVSMTNAKVTQRFIGGNIPPGDKDYWKINAKAGDKVSLACGCRRNGAGVADFTVDFFKDPAMPALQTEVETAKKDIAWEDKATYVSATMPQVSIATAGVYYVRLSSTSLVQNGASGTWYNCGVATVSP